MLGKYHTLDLSDTNITDEGVKMLTKCRNILSLWYQCDG